MNELAERVSLGKNQQAWPSALLILLAVLVISSGSPAGQAQDSSSPPAQPLPADQELRFEHLTTEDGLSEGRIWGLTQDSRGFMWFASWDGLNRFDGHEFKVYRHDPGDPSSPPATQFKRAYEDSTGILWFGTWGEGLVRFDPATEQWRGYRNDPDDPHSLSSDAIWAIQEDSSNQLWIGTEGGLDRFDAATEQFVHFRHDAADPDSLSDSAVLSILEDSSGILWIGTFSGGLDRYDPESGRFTHYVHDPNNPQSLSGRQVFCIYEDREGMLWLGFWEDTLTGGLNRFDPETGQVTRYEHDPDDPNSLSNNIVTAIHQDDSGTLWVATYGGGLNRLNLEMQRFSRFSFDPNDASSLGHANALAIHQDQAGMLWIGTGGGGVSMLDLERKPFSLYQHQGSDPNSLVANDVRSILEDSSGDLWVGTAGSGLTRLDREMGQATYFEYAPDDPTGLSGNTVTALAEDQSGAIWIGTLDGGLNRFDKQTETFTHFHHDPNDPHSPSFDDVNVVLEDRSEVLWVGTWSGGLNSFDRESERFTHYVSDPDDPNSLSSNAVLSLLQDRTGSLWVGTVGGGLNRLDLTTDGGQERRFDRFLNDLDDGSSLSNNSVYALYEDQDGALWVGTADGLNRFDPDTHIFERWSEQDGFSNGFVNGILGDEQGNLWVSTNGGLSRFNPRTGQIRNYSASDGLQGDQFSYAAAFRSPSGELFFGGPNGLTAFFPQQIKDNPHVPPVFVTDIEINYQPVSVGEEGPLTRSPIETEALTLSHLDRVLSLQFAALNYRSPDGTRYRYMLEGFDTGWRDVDSSQRSATYTNLDPGQYTFRVLGSNSDGLWNEEGRSIAITITPPWWGTWWFRGGMLLLLVGLVAGGFVWQRDSARKREHNLEATVAERTHELDERVKELDCLYGISRLAGQQGISLEEILQGTVQLIPPALQYPEIACACITLDGREFKTANCEESPWQLRADIVIRARRAGSVEAGYLEERPERDEGPFLAEELDLLNAIAERLGRITERKQAEEQVRFQAHMLATVEQAVIVTDIEGHVIYWNPFAEKLYGWSAEAALGRMTNELIAGNYDQPVNREIMACIQAGESWSGEYIARRRDGTRFPVQTAITAITDAGGEPTHLVGISADITERKQAEEALQKSEEKYRDLVEQVSDVIYSVDSGGVITYLNPAIEALIGLPPEQVVGQPLAQFIHPEDLGRLQDNLQSLLSGAAPGSAEYRLLSTAGEVRWIRVTSQPMVKAGQVIGVQGVLSDVTERNRLEEQLQAAARASERQRLARDLHDSVTQTLYSTSLFADAMHLALSTGRTDAAREHLDAVRDLVWQATLEMRMLLFELRPPLLEETGLAGAIQTRLESVEARVGLPIEFRVEGERRLSPAVEEELYHLALEALNNIAKHAQATQASVCLELEEECCRLVINDDGVGFDPEAASRGGGQGLRSMQERVAKIGGRLDLESAPGQGTTVTIEVKA